MKGQFINVLRATICSSALLALAACDSSSNSGSGTPTPNSDTATSKEIGVQISGAPSEDEPHNATDVELNFSPEGDLPEGYEVVGFECKSDQAGDFQPCESDPFILSNLKDGQTYTLKVRPIILAADGEVSYGREASMSFRVSLANDGSASSPTSANTGSPSASGDKTPSKPKATSSIADFLQVGSSFAAQVPEGMHVTEYSTSKTTGVLSIFRVLPDSDPNYLGNFRCDKDFDRVMSSLSPAGQIYSYCHRTPTRDEYKAMHEHRLANNHVEVATDAALVTDGNHERLSLSVFDSDWEFVTARSRFSRVCMNSVKNKVRVPLLNDFFIGHHPEEVDFWYCDTYIAGMNGSPELWRVGAFYDIDAIDWQCEECSYDRGVEAVYMVRANAAIFTPALFARRTQERVLDIFTKITP